MFEELCLGNTIELRNKHPIKNEEKQFRAILTIVPTLNFTLVQIKSLPQGTEAAKIIINYLIRYLKNNVGGKIQIDLHDKKIKLLYEPQRHLIRLKENKSNNVGKALLSLGLFGLATYAIVKYSPNYQEDIKPLIHRICG